MIAALYLSRRTKSSNHFLHKGVHFGWEALESMLKREVNRIRQNQIPRVPGLKESYIYRDPWTRLNVKPAKIMQVHCLHNMCITLALNVCIMFSLDCPSNSKNMY